MSKSFEMCVFHSESRGSDIRNSYESEGPRDIINLLLEGNSLISYSRGVREQITDDDNRIFILEFNQSVN